MVRPNHYGLSRIQGEVGVLPQRARTLDPSLPLRDGELLIDVDSLNIDAASFKQLKEAAGGDLRKLEAAVRDIVAERGKLHNPVTGSGGMLIGRVRELHPSHPAYDILRPGDRIATLVSLTLTPLHLERILAVHADKDRVDVKGHAILFSSGIWARIPDDFPQSVTLAALDVCGAPALVARHVKPGMNVLVLGSGKSGALCLAQARESLKGQGRVLGLDVSQKALTTLQEYKLVDVAIHADATEPITTLQRVTEATGGALADLVINCASVPNTEMSSILSVKDGGTVIFFSMATSFTAAALGAEGVGKDASLIMGNGYVPGHADLTMNLLRRHKGLLKLFTERYS